jgi:hypothetical protein
VSRQRQPDAFDVSSLVAANGMVSLMPSRPGKVCPGQERHFQDGLGAARESGSGRSRDCQEQQDSGLFHFDELLDMPQVKLEEHFLNA